MADEITKKKQIKPIKSGDKPDRDEKGRFTQGNRANPEGRPEGTKNYLKILEEAITKYETETGKKLFDRLIQRAFVNDMVLLSVAKKFIADKNSTEITTPEGIEFIITREK